MLSLLKVFGRGILTTLLLPIILLIWIGYGVYCLVVFVIMFFKGLIDYFKGKDFNGDMIEDLDARRMLLEKEQTDEQAKQALNMMYQTALARNEFGNVDSPFPNENHEDEGNDFPTEESDYDQDESLDSDEYEEPEDDLRNY